MNNIPGPINLGWPKITKDFTITQGNKGYINFNVVALNDGSAYSSYVGFTAKLSIVTSGLSVIKTLTSANGDITITNTPPSTTLAFKIIFKSQDTILFPADSILLADLMVISPDGIEKQFPLSLKIKVLPSYTR